MVSDKPSDYYGRPSIASSIYIDDIVDRMLEQGSTVTRPDILAVIENAVKTTENLLLEGNRVNFGDLVQLYPKIRGSFGGQSDFFNRSRHKIDVGATAGTRIRNNIHANAVVIKEEASIPMPNPIEFHDLLSDEMNISITPGSIGTVIGNRLKYDAARSDEGIFLIKMSDNSEIKMHAVQKNKPGELVFLVPSTLTADDTMAIEIRSRISGETIRAGRLAEELTVGV